MKIDSMTPDLEISLAQGYRHQMELSISLCFGADDLMSALMDMDPEDKLAVLDGAIDELSDEERLELFSGYCKHCGTDDPDCNCWRDE